MEALCIGNDTCRCHFFAGLYILLPSLALFLGLPHEYSSDPDFIPGRLSALVEEYIPLVLWWQAIELSSVFNLIYN
jgi:hypothetical protein